MELDDDLHRRITALCSGGDELVALGRNADALTKYREALALVPAPRTRWEASTWIYAAIGDVLFASEEFVAAAAAFRDACNCPGGMENPFIQLRLGQCLYELHDSALASEHLLRAYMLEGSNIFAGEDPKYAALIERAIGGTG